jgi:hypothetical protein
VVFAAPAVASDASGRGDVRGRRWSSVVVGGRRWKNLRRARRRGVDSSSLRARYGRARRACDDGCDVCVCVCASSETDVGHRARRERGGRDDDIRERIVDL